MNLCAPKLKLTYGDPGKGLFSKGETEVVCNCLLNSLSRSPPIQVLTLVTMQPSLPRQQMDMKNIFTDF